MAGSVMFISVGSTAFCSLLNLKGLWGAGSAPSLRSRLLYSTNWPTQKRSGLDNPVGVASRSSRSPGSAFGARVTRTETVSAMAGFPFLLGANRMSFWRIAASSVSSAAVHTTFVPACELSCPPRFLALAVAAARLSCSSLSFSRRSLNSFCVRGRE